MTGQGSQLLHAGVFPYNDLILGVAVRAHKFIYVLRKHKVANLASSLITTLRLKG
jgi:hypothetical protein